MCLHCGPSEGGVCLSAESTLSGSPMSPPSSPSEWPRTGGGMGLGGRNGLLLPASGERAPSRP